MHMRGKTICEFTVIIEDLGFEADLGFELNLGSLEQRSLSRSLTCTAAQLLPHCSTGCVNVWAVRREAMTVGGDSGALQYDGSLLLYTAVQGFGRCALPRAAPTSGAERATGLWLRRA